MLGIWTGMYPYPADRSVTVAGAARQVVFGAATVADLTGMDLFGEEASWCVPCWTHPNYFCLSRSDLLTLGSTSDMGTTFSCWRSMGRSTWSLLWHFLVSGDASLACACRYQSCSATTACNIGRLDTVVSRRAALVWVSLGSGASFRSCRNLCTWCWLALFHSWLSL